MSTTGLRMVRKCRPSHFGVDLLLAHPLIFLPRPEYPYLEAVAMAIFYGNHEQAIDAKRRLPITAALREFIDSEHDGNSFSALIWADGHLRLYPREYYLRLIGQSLEKSTSSAEHEAMAKLYQRACTLRPDAQGRVVLPEKLIADAGLPNEVVLRGINDHIEIWPLDQWQSSSETVDAADVDEIAFRAAQQLAREDREAAARKQQ